MDRNIATERAWPADFWSVGVEPLRSPPADRKAALLLSGGEALILVLLLSLGFWVTIWGAVALLTVGGR
jgi:hypothetical protein